MAWIKEHLALLAQTRSEADAIVCGVASVVSVRGPPGRAAPAAISPSAVLIRLLAEHVVASLAQKVRNNARHQQDGHDKAGDNGTLDTGGWSTG